MLYSPIQIRPKSLYIPGFFRTQDFFALSAAFAGPKPAAEPIAFGKTQKALFVSPSPDTASKRAKGIYEIP